ncbi:MAG TPA: alpha-amylase family protein [Acidobacteriaceae bacterium]|jgi:alpha-glucosidase
MLARPGHVGSGLGNEPWWKHAVVYQVQREASNDQTDFKALAVRIDAFKSLGVDALLLPAPDLPAPGTNAAMPSFDDLENLLRRASSHGIRVLLTIHAANATDDLSGTARFWLTRGVAGLYIAPAPGSSPQDEQVIIDKLRKLASTFAGQRIVVSDLDATSPAPPPRGRTPQSAKSSTLQIDTRADHLATLDAASLRPLLAETQQNLLLDLHASSSLAQAVAAIAILGHPSTLIDSSANLVLEPTPEPVAAPEEPAKPAAAAPAQPPTGTYLPYVPYVPPTKPKPAVEPKPIPMDPLTAWYKQLFDLNHGNAVLRSGSKTLLDFDAQNTLVWIIRPAAGSVRTPPVVVAINLSGSPVQLSLADAIKKLGLRGFFLRTLLRSDHGMGAQDIQAVNVGAFGVYIGELRF